MYLPRSSTCLSRGFSIFRTLKSWAVDSFIISSWGLICRQRWRALGVFAQIQDSRLGKRSRGTTSHLSEFEVNWRCRTLSSQINSSVPNMLIPWVPVSRSPSWRALTAEKSSATLPVFFLKFRGQSISSCWENGVRKRFIRFLRSRRIIYRVPRTKRIKSS